MSITLITKMPPKMFSLFQSFFSGASNVPGTGVPNRGRDVVTY